MASQFPTAVDNETPLVDGTDKMRASTSINLAFLDITAAQTMIGASGAAQSHNTDILTQLANFKAPQLAYNGTNNFDVLAGAIVTQNAGGSIKKLRRNTSTVNVTASNLDTGAMAAGYYYVYAIADSAATTFTIKFSATANAAPSGTTNYVMIGWFYNETGGVLDVTNKQFGNVKAIGRDVPNVVTIQATASQTLSSTSFADINNMSIRFYTSGRPVLIQSTCSVVDSGSGVVQLTHCFNDGSDISASEQIGSSGISSTYYMQLPNHYIYVPAAGTYTFKLRAKVGANSVDFKNRRLSVIEL